MQDRKEIQRGQWGFMHMNRRIFLRTIGEQAAGLLCLCGLDDSSHAGNRASKLPNGWLNPSREFSLCPFWFWNDNLSEKEIDRQLADFQDHEVHAFVIHPRAGLPRKTGEGILDFARRIAAGRPAVGPQALAIAESYVSLRYDEHDPQRNEEFKALVRRFNPAKSRRGD